MGNQVSNLSFIKKFFPPFNPINYRCFTEVLKMPNHCRKRFPIDKSRNLWYN